MEELKLYLKENRFILTMWYVNVQDVDYTEEPIEVLY